jgi:hypothetical protein
LWLKKSRPKVSGWQGLLLMSNCLASSGSVCRIWLPESPVMVDGKRRVAEAEAIRKRSQNGHAVSPLTSSLARPRRKRETPAFSQRGLLLWFVTQDARPLPPGLSDGNSVLHIPWRRSLCRLNTGTDAAQPQIRWTCLPTRTSYQRLRKSESVRFSHRTMGGSKRKLSL